MSENKNVANYRGMTMNDFPEAVFPVIGALKRLESIEKYTKETNTPSSIKGNLHNLRNFFIEAGYGKTMTPLEISDNSARTMKQIKEAFRVIEAPQSIRSAIPFLDQCLGELYLKSYADTRR